MVYIIILYVSCFIGKMNDADILINRICIQISKNIDNRYGSNVDNKLEILGQHFNNQTKCV